MYEKKADCSGVQGEPCTKKRPIAQAYNANLVRKNHVFGQAYNANLVRKNHVFGQAYNANLVRKTHRPLFTQKTPKKNFPPSAEK
ncbi:MAG: hypothetical protein DRR19_28945 [Candidatus Parabeggiatoa sp. nov. 1]|nr:MAG: hypothetical protein DRR19_28945 [Gammaproteobacteria bacterium]